MVALFEWWCALGVPTRSIFGALRIWVAGFEQQYLVSLCVWFGFWYIHKYLIWNVYLLFSKFFTCAVII